MLWAKSTDDILKYFLIFPQKTGFDISCKLSPKEISLIFFFYCSKKIRFDFLCKLSPLLRRQFALNVKSYFLGKIRKLFQNVICWNFYPACQALGLCREKLTCYCIIIVIPVFDLFIVWWRFVFYRMWRLIRWWRMYRDLRGMIRWGSWQILRVASHYSSVKQTIKVNYRKCHNILNTLFHTILV